MVHSDYALGLLRSIAWDAEDAAGTLLDALKSALRGGVSSAPGGQIVLSTSGNGRSVTFDNGGLKAQDTIGLLNRFYSVYQSANADLIVAEIAVPTDAQILTEMEARAGHLIGGNFTESTNDYSNFRCGLEVATT